MDIIPSEKKTRRKKDVEKKLSIRTAVRFDNPTSVRIERCKKVKNYSDTSKFVRDAVNEKLDRDLPENK